MTTFKSKKDQLDTLLAQYLISHPEAQPTRVTVLQVVRWLTGLDEQAQKDDITTIPEHVFSKGTN